VSRTVDTLVRQNLIDRSEDPRNRRAVILTRTGAGCEITNRLNRENDSFYARVLDRMEPDLRRQFQTGFDAFVEAMKEIMQERGDVS